MNDLSDDLQFPFGVRDSARALESAIASVGQAIAVAGREYAPAAQRLGQAAALMGEAFTLLRAVLAVEAKIAERSPR